MKLEFIKEKAQQEIFQLEPYILEIEKAIKQSPFGCDINIPSFMIPQIEEYCDKYSIPFFHLTSNSCSVANTYRQLYEYERCR